MMSKLYLEKKGVTVDERNVSGNKEYMKTMIENGWSSTPMVIIGNTIIKGYKPKDFDNAIRNQ